MYIIGSASDLPWYKQPCTIGIFLYSHSAGEKMLAHGPEYNRESIMCRVENSFQIFRWITGTKGNGVGASCLRYNTEVCRIASNGKPLMLRPESSDVTRMISILSANRNIYSSTKACNSYHLCLRKPCFYGCASSHTIIGVGERTPRRMSMRRPNG